MRSQEIASTTVGLGAVTVIDVVAIATVLAISTLISYLEWAQEETQIISFLLYEPQHFPSAVS
jgi:hypothetical protein